MESQWEKTFQEAVGDFVLDPNARKVAKLLCKKTDAISPEQHKAIRTVFRATDLHETAKCSAWCRMMCWRLAPSPELDWPADLV